MDKFLDLLRKIKQKLIIVEGKNDKIALEHFGIVNVMVLERRALFQVVEEVALRTKECVILVDLDKEGKKIYGKLKKDLNMFGVRIDDELRNYLYKHTKLRQVEGLVHYIEKNKNKGSINA